MSVPICNALLLHSDPEAALDPTKDVLSNTVKVLKNSGLQLFNSLQSMKEHILV